MPIPSLKVVGRLGITVIDGTDADDEPDVVYCDEGTVVLTPVIAHTFHASGTPLPPGLGNHPIEGQIDSDGYITWRGLRYIKVYDLTSDQLNPRVAAGKATHQVEFKGVKRDGVDVRFPSHPVRIAPDTAVNGECNLMKLLPVPVGGGTAVVIGPPGPPGDPDLTDEVTATNLATGPLTRAALEDAADELGLGGGAASWADLDGKPSLFPPTVHPHAIGDVTNLQGALDALSAALGGKAAQSHTHAITNVTGLQGALDGLTAALGAKPTMILRNQNGTWPGLPNPAPASIIWADLTDLPPSDPAAFREGQDVVLDPGTA